MVITCLVENTPARPAIHAEHGLSLFVEWQSERKTHRVLFDMGPGTLFAENARRLGVDLRTADLAVISHGHYDHGGGLETFLQINPTAPVYLSASAFEGHFNAVNKDIGLDVKLAGQTDRLRFVGEDVVIEPGVTLYTCLDRERRYPLMTDGLQARRGDSAGLVPEDFRHEIYLLIEENGRRILFSGCSHRGILEIEEWFRPDILIGGFHFMHRKIDESLKRDAQLLGSYPTEYYTCHCTGLAQYDFMRSEMTELHYLACGDRIDL